MFLYRGVFGGAAYNKSEIFTVILVAYSKYLTSTSSAINLIPAVGYSICQPLFLI